MPIMEVPDTTQSCIANLLLLRFGLWGSVSLRRAR